MAASGEPRDGTYGVPGTGRKAVVLRRLLAAYVRRVGLDVRVTEDAERSCNRFVARLLDRVADADADWLRVHRTADVAAALGLSEVRFARLAGKAAIGQHLWSTREVLGLSECVDGADLALDAVGGSDGQGG